MHVARAPAGERSLVFISPTELHTRKITHGSLLAITHVLPPELVAQGVQPHPTIAVAVSDPSVPLGLISAHPTLFSNTVLSPLGAADPTPHVNSKVAPESVRITPLPSLPMASRVLVIVDRVRPSTEAALHALLRRKCRPSACVGVSHFDAYCLVFMFVSVQRWSHTLVGASDRSRSATNT